VPRILGGEYVSTEEGKPLRWLAVLPHVESCVAFFLSDALTGAGFSGDSVRNSNRSGDFQRAY